MLRIRKKGQTLIEYTVMIIILLGAFLAIQNYLKRGMQGRWKAVVDDMGDQYDPQRSNSYIRQGIVSNSETRIIAFNAAGGFWTSRVDLSNSVETRSGSISVGAF